MSKKLNASQDQIDRRSLIKTIGMGTLVGGLGVLVSEKSGVAQEDGDPNLFAFWTHGNAAGLQYPDRITATEHFASSMRITGQPGTFSPCSE